MALVVSVAILRNPVQVTDSLVPMLVVQNDSATTVFRSMLSEATGLSRPLYWVQIKLLLDASRGHYFIVYKLFHVAFIAALFALFVRACRVTTRNDAAAFVFALVVLTGTQMFLGMAWESYPVNHYLEIAVFSVAALVLCQSRGGWGADVAAAVLFTVASLTLDSGLLVWVVVVAARLVGLRGVSWRGVAVITGLLTVYMLLRFGALGIGSPDVGERATGFGFARLEPDEIQRRFVETGRLGYFYLYNVGAAFVSLFLSEPTNGQWAVTQRLATGTIAPWVVNSVVSAVVATGLLLWFAATRWGSWRQLRFSHADQLVLVFLAVALANALMCYSYVKDEIMSTAGVFYALAVFSATREALTRSQGSHRTVAVTLALAVVLCAGSVAWTVRTTGLQYQMVRMGTSDRYEWAHVEEWLARQNQTPTTEGGVQLVQQMRTEAVRTRPLSLLYVPRWAVRWFIPR